MPEQTIRRGQLAVVAQPRPNLSSPNGPYPLITNTLRRMLLLMPLPQVAGRVVLSATLSMMVRGNAATQNITVKPIADKWDVDSVTWANQPSIRSGSASSGTTGSLSEGQRVEVDVTSLVQQVANGQRHWGWQVTTTESVLLYGFASGPSSFILNIETSDAPLEPTSLAPAGVISRSKFVVRCDFTDLGGSTDQAAIQVRVDANATAPYDYDTGEVATTDPELDLSGTFPNGTANGAAATTYAGLASGASTKWQVRVKDSDGYWSPWSDWTTVTRILKPGLTLDTPALGKLGDPTSDVTAHIGSGTIRAYSVQIARADRPDDVRWSTGRRTGSGTTLAATIPLRNGDGERVFRDDVIYRLRIRVWDRLDRVQGGPDDPPFVEHKSTFVFDDDAALAAPTQVLVQPTPDAPSARVQWTRAGSADGWLIHRDGELAARLDPADVVNVGGGTYRWNDGEAPPNSTLTYTVRAIVNGKRGLPRNATGVNEVTGVWLRSDEYGDVMLDGGDLDGFARVDNRATYVLPGRKDQVDVIGSIGGLTGSFVGYLGVRHYRSRADVDALRARLKRIRNNPTSPVRLLFGTENVPVLLRNLSVTPYYKSADGLETPLSTHEHRVSFECWQVGDF